MFKGIAIDLDGTVFNTIKRICEMYNEDFCLYEGFVPVDWQDIKTWEFKELFLETPENVDKYFCKPRFFYNLDLYPGAKWIINQFRKKYPVMFVSSGYAPNLILKKMWLKKQFPDTEFYGVDLSKHEDKSSVDLKGWVFIDDVAKNLETSNASLKICFGKTYPWNENWDGLRCEYWAEIYSEVKKHESKV